jgi:hypothetical protein
MGFQVAKKQERLAERTTMSVVSGGESKDCPK